MPGVTREKEMRVETRGTSSEPPTDDPVESCEKRALPSSTDEPAAQTSRYRDAPLTVQVTGWRQKILLISVFIGLFLSFLDTTIVSVALPTIAAEFDEYDRSTWVITAYLLTYMAFAIIITRLSDIFGRKAIEVTNFLLFIAFSLACALSQSMTQLIVFRAFQGIGGSGLFSMTIVIAMNAVSRQKQSAVGGAIGGVMVTSGVLGPVLSGAITQSHHGSTWRWIFYLNLPVGGVALLLLLMSWPSDKSRKSLSMDTLKTVDFFGCLLLLAASILLIFALQEGGAGVYAWSSGTIIACLVISTMAFLAFVLWQIWLASHPALPVKPVFPVKLMAERVIGSTMLVALLIGFVFYIAVVSLPQRFQIVDGDSPVTAGVKLLPLMASSAVGSLVTGGINSGKNRTRYTLIVASAFQVLGYGLMISLGNTRPTPTRQFGFQVFLGLGFGMAVTTVTIIGRQNVELRWTAVTQGALTQMRSLGGSIGLSVGVIVFNNRIRGSRELAAQLTPDQMRALTRSPLAISQFSPQEQEMVGMVYAKAFTQEMQVATYIAAACFVVSLVAWQRSPPQSYAVGVAEPGEGSRTGDSRGRLDV